VGRHQLVDQWHLLRRLQVKLLQGRTQLLGLILWQRQIYRLILTHLPLFHQPAMDQLVAQRLYASATAGQLAMQEAVAHILTQPPHLQVQRLTWLFLTLM
jgi:hypothetical protein